MKINRRKFMKVFTGITAGLCATSKAKELKYEVSCDPGSKSVVKYDLIADLVEEMNNYDKKFPDRHIRYYIHCNYTGLAFLNDKGGLEREINYIDYSHMLWICIFKPHHNALVRVLPMGTESDLNLIGRTRKKRSFYMNAGIHSHRYRYELVTTRCFNVDRNEEGKKIAMGGWRPLPEDLPHYTHDEIKLVSFDDKTGEPWVKPIKQKDFYKNG